MNATHNVINSKLPGYFRPTKEWYLVVVKDGGICCLLNFSFVLKNINDKADEISLFFTQIVFNVSQDIGGIESQALMRSSRSEQIINKDRLFISLRRHACCTLCSGFEARPTMYRNGMKP